MEKQPKNTASINDNELKNITGGSFGYGTDICCTCGKTFQGDALTRNKQKGDHFEKTGHSQFRSDE